MSTTGYASSATPVSLVPHRLFGWLAMLWVGSQLTIGYMVAPVLFASLDRVVAGGIAAQLFRLEGIVGVVCGVLLLGLSNLLTRRGAAGYRRLRWVLAIMLLCVLIGYFALQPFMNALRVQAMSAGMDVASSPYASRFGLLHGVSSLFYLVQSLLGAWLVWLLPSARAAGLVQRAESAPR
ncbi:uncharacterized protein DUF4149 [Paraburkholderia unamae]|uniref:Uncharacterized protein DUF4149 n=2 Tax=Paraburkholderia unamae TaxID=219649 RepID=A0ABX5KN32_9BURK|nr:uncharacterized protein DUF4149 [Paraburkholderia unamae]RAR63841.1 uncharacterized protein DUF4149 [Paraburkholderia unamae]